MISTPVIHINTRITTHVPTPEGWKAGLAGTGRGQKGNVAGIGGSRPSCKQVDAYKPNINEPQNRYNELSITMGSTIILTFFV